MILKLFSRSPRSDSIAALYGAIVAQARSPAFYRIYGVPDTVNGRFEMIVLHAVLVLARLDAEGEKTRALGQAVFDCFCGDMDANLREMGVGDIAVPRRMKAIGEAFYGRQRAYEAAMNDAASEPLAEALARNVYAAEPGKAPSAVQLAAYAQNAAGRLAALDRSALLAGRTDFPDPVALMSPAARLDGANTG
jgi:cytochrome b pre-mRNA-processing protein 3